MRTAKHLLMVCVVAAAVFCGSAISQSAWAHCDTLDGPVVQAARTALDSGNVNYVLIWVKQAVEAEIKEAFRQALEVRKLGAAAKDLADRHFFETIVRVHRQGEGAGFSGLKPAGLDLGPAIPAADKAIETGSLDSLAQLVTESVQHGLKERFADVMAKKSFKTDDVAAGQQYVESYVGFVHFVERLHQDATHAPAGHFAEH